MNQRSQALRALVHSFVQQRLDGKLDKLKPDDDTGQRAELIAQHQPIVWLRDAARRAAQLQVVTHSAKAGHPDSKGSSLRASDLPSLSEVGSHLLAEAPPLDVVGNAAALDVFKFLKQVLPGEATTLLDLTRSADPDWLAALADDPAEAQALCHQFAALEQPRGRLASHTLAKQILWPTREDADAGWQDFHALAPLFPTALVHRVHEQAEAWRFGDDAVAARDAFGKKLWHAPAVHELPHRAQLKLGGSKPQNISQLNSERGGRVPLLASLPPQWQSPALRPPLGSASLFDTRGQWPRIAAVREALEGLVALLRKAGPGSVGNAELRAAQDALVVDLADALLNHTLALRDGLEPGWSLQSSCRLPLSQRQWLDPEGSPCDEPDDLALAVASSFAQWLNDALRAKKLLMDRASFDHWRNLAEDVLKDFAPEAAATTQEVPHAA